MNKWQDKNILVILPRWGRTFIGNNVGRLMTALTARSANVRVYCASSSDDKFFALDFPEGVLCNSRPMGGLVRRTYNFFKVICRVKPDLVLWTYSGYFENILLAILRICFGIPYVIKNDSLVLPEPNLLKSKIARQVFYKFPESRANLILAETGEVELHLRKRNNPERVYLFPNGVPVSEFLSMEAQFKLEDAPTETPYILYTGRIHSDKGVDLLIESFCLMADRCSPWTLHIVGPSWDSSYEEKCKKMVADRKMDKRIIFHPFVGGVELYKWYSSAEVFVLPSREEGLANRLCEAMFFKNPVVAFNVGQTANLVTSRTGSLVRKGDIRALSEEIYTLAQDKKKRIEMGRNARREIVEKYNYDKILPDLLEKCEGILR